VSDSCHPFPMCFRAAYAIRRRKAQGARREARGASPVQRGCDAGAAAAGQDSGDAWSISTSISLAGRFVRLAKGVALDAFPTPCLCIVHPSPVPGMPSPRLRRSPSPLNVQSGRKQSRVTPPLSIKPGVFKSPLISRKLRKLRDLPTLPNLRSLAPRQECIDQNLAGESSGE
jgi:hypothetical protein